MFYDQFFCPLIYCFQIVANSSGPLSNGPVHWPCIWKYSRPTKMKGAVFFVLLIVSWFFHCFFFVVVLFPYVKRNECGISQTSESVVSDACWPRQPGQRWQTRQRESGRTTVLRDTEGALAVVARWLTGPTNGSRRSNNHSQLLRSSTHSGSGDSGG